jgi:isoquinoline 1-oxidoreductase beta subunit
MDELAELAGKDPIEFHPELFERAKNKPVGKDNDYDVDRYAGVLKLVKRKVELESGEQQRSSRSCSLLLPQYICRRSDRSGNE